MGLDIEGSGYPAVGDSLQRLTQPEGTTLLGNDPAARSIERRIVRANVGHTYQAEALGALRQTQPYPLAVLGVAREVEYGNV